MQKFFKIEIIKNLEGFQNLQGLMIAIIVIMLLSPSMAYAEETSETTAGYAIIIQGKKSECENNLKYSRKTTDFVYNTLISRGFSEENIRYFYYEDENTTRSDKRDDEPSRRAEVQNAIISWAKYKMNNNPANLYIVMVGPGGIYVTPENEQIGLFYIDPMSISSKDIHDWLETLCNSLNQQALNQAIVMVLGFCNSGAFIPYLSGDNRIIIASADANESSYSGAMDEDGIRQGDYFVYEFFNSFSYLASKSGTKISIKESFKQAALLTKTYTFSPEAKNIKYMDNSLQHPLLDDNGDGVGTNFLNDSDGDGSLSDKVYLGTAPSSENVFIQEVADTIFLNEQQDSTDALWAIVNDMNRVKSIWIEIKEPNDALPANSEECQVEMNLQRVVANNSDNTEKKFKWTNINAFSIPGTYQVFYFAKDNVTENISHLTETTVYKAKPGNSPPEPFSLLYPMDGANIKTSLILDWEDAKDPDGDEITYTVELSKGNNSFSNPIRIKGLSHSYCKPENFITIEDLTDYYWRVIAIDEYGATQTTDVWRFHTDDIDGILDPYLHGFVTNQWNAPIINAIVIVSNAQDGYEFRTIDDGSYNGILKKEKYRQYTLTVDANGCYPKEEMIDLNDNKEEYQVDFSLTCITDIIQVLKVLCGMKVNGVNDLNDVNGDGKMGLEEAVFMLQGSNFIDNY